MAAPVPLTEIWRGDRVESLHLGHIVISTPSGEILQEWGDARTVIYPRSSAKMIQALPLVESGAADAAGLTSEQLALACASHNGAHIHTDRVEAWLGDLGLTDDDLRCGAHMPHDAAAAKEITCSNGAPRQVHNNCSGKHAGFLTLTKHLGAGPEYVDIDHPVQRAIRAAWEDVTGEPVHGWSPDGCSAPNFATSLQGIARAMAFFAAARPNGATVRERAAARLREAMARHPELVAGEGRACTRLMRAMNGNVVIKTGAEAVYIAMLPEKKLGVALKIADGATRASEATIAAILVRLGVLDRDSEVTHSYLDAPIVNWRGIKTGYVRPAQGLLD
ncbi:MAG: L-asparaginase [Rhodobacterales bacterium CG2_30_65_12]|nr:MAG: L-asparaginase [Rhodobacterales bacterium CG2_30_65_12]